MKFIGQGHRVLGHFWADGVVVDVQAPRTARRLRSAALAGAPISIYVEDVAEIVVLPPEVPVVAPEPVAEPVVVLEPEPPVMPVAAPVQGGLGEFEMPDMDFGGVVEEPVSPLEATMDAMHHAKLGRVCRQLVASHNLEEVYQDWGFRSRMECQEFLRTFVAQYGWESAKEAFLEVDVKL